MNERMAPGHVYQPRLGTGIQWQSSVVKLWEGGHVTVEATHNTASPYEFWYNLAFKDCFHEVTHWWFRSAWTQRVRLTKPQGILSDGALWGVMQFIDEQNPGHMYTILDTDPPVISVPYPPNEAQPVNLPLRLSLTHLVYGVIVGNLIPNQWHVVTSLVGRDDLNLVFATTLGFIPWKMDDINTSLREALCCVQGLELFLSCVR